jgi:hypothetical protein
MIYVTEEQYQSLYPTWVHDAPIQTLADIWVARYGNEWVCITDVEADFSFVASRLIEAQKLMVHRPAPDAVRRFKIVGLEE